MTSGVGFDEAADASVEAATVAPVTDSEDDLADRFAGKHADGLRYCETLGGWFEWTGGRWRRDEQRRVPELARQVCRTAAREQLGAGGTQRAGERLSSAATVRAVVSLASGDPRLATIASAWDRDPWSLNTPAGTVDLRTGILRPHDRLALLSKITAAAPEHRSAPIWMKFLDTVTDGDRDLQYYLQIVAGYCLTGSIREHALFFFYGPGGNGKGTFLNTLTAILGDYACVAGMETFTESHSDRHPAELAMLRGARLVTAQETEDGRRWAESRIKALTGGDPITARFMRQDFFTFHPTFKLLIAGNHKPALRTVDEAIRRRFHMLPFVARIPPEQCDPELFDKLRAEWPAILAWAVEGCTEWQLAGGLRTPAAVMAATDEYLAEQDSIRTWIAECCESGPQFHGSTSSLFASWTAWAQAQGEKAGTARRFSQTLQRLGYQTAKHLPGQHGKRGFCGIAVLSNDMLDPL